MSTITAVQEGRNLHIRVEGIADPYVVKPLPGNAGLQITDTYIAASMSQATAEETTDALAIALDGAVFDETTERWVPNVDRPNSVRIGNELSLMETDTVAMTAFYWQTILGIKGVELFLASQGGVEGHTKALTAVTQRMGLSRLLTSPSSALESLTLLQGSSPSTSTRPGGAKPARQPQDRRPKRGRRRKV